ncbi:MAG TPA: ATP-dependent DNA helicase RecG [Candidatus Dormibacteraeota bacterium]|nr:ATP-dependent DNA helicase RecG [Candidatus Dormibacteraeota bacterium]
MPRLTLDDPVTAITGIDKAYRERLDHVGVKTVRDLLLYFPRRHDDFASVTPIAWARPGMRTTVRGQVYQIEQVRTSRKHMRIARATVSDDSGQLNVVWFNQPYIARQLHAGDQILLAGTVELNGGLVMKNPEYERASKDPTHAARIVPVYPETRGLTSRWLRPKILPLLWLAEQFEETLPAELVVRRRLMSRPQAIKEMHFPSSMDARDRARERFVFEEIFVNQVANQLAKRARKSHPAHAIAFDEAAARAFVAALPFTLTNAQRKAAWQILTDMTKGEPMNRLLEGDVGSGKTAVAAMAMHHTHQAGFQSMLLAPTEILARQHADVVESLLRPFGVVVGMLLGSTAAAARRALLQSVAEGAVQVLVGTHALLEEDVRFKALALSIVDEQHRFGVEQRLAARQRETWPHFLSMTATPIPRTLGLTLFGDLDISVLDEMPPGRPAVVTRLVPPDGRQAAYDFIRQQVNEKHQVFVVCPLIQESDKLGVRSATEEVEKLRADVFPELAGRIGLLHGRMKPAEKEEVMGRFQRGEIAILVATSVVEVGIDIPNATVIMIEGADRFGLAQLHQFRGRVRRGTHQSYCLLFTDVDDLETMNRLNAVVTHTSGFDLAEIDLRLRGMGDIHGVRQHGHEFKMASLLDAALISDVQAEAVRLLERDPKLDGEPALRRQLAAYRLVYALD